VKQLLVLALFIASPTSVIAQLVLPGSAPINWSAGAVNSTAYHWNNFLLGGTYPGPLVPDQATFNPGLSNAGLTETTGMAFLTSGGNIYSPSFAIAISTTLPNYNFSSTPGGDWNTTVFVQTRTIGSEINYAGLTLGWTDGVGPQSVTTAQAFYSQELERVPNPGFGGFVVTNIWGFNVPFNPSQFTLNFAGAESSVSLDQLRVDTFATPVPEPSSMMLLGGAALAWWRRRARA
jgi:hypothetical protein